MATPAVPITQYRFSVDPAVYQHFLRINNRRRTHTVDEFNRAGYPCVNLPWIQQFSAREWCKNALAPGTWVGRYQWWWFARQEDAMQFQMTMLD